MWFAAYNYYTRRRVADFISAKHAFSKSLVTLIAVASQTPQWRFQGGARVLKRQVRDMDCVVPGAMHGN